MLGPGLRKLALKRETGGVPRRDPQKLQSEELPRGARQPSPPGSQALPVAEQSWSPARAAPSGPFLESGPLLPHPGSSCGGLCQRPLWGKVEGAAHPLHAGAASGAPSHPAPGPRPPSTPACPTLSPACSC